VESAGFLDSDVGVEWDWGGHEGFELLAESVEALGFAVDPAFALGELVEVSGALMPGHAAPLVGGHAGHVLIPQWSQSMAYHWRASGLASLLLDQVASCWHLGQRAVHAAQ
jgi:hypothetical protein